MEKKRVVPVWVSVVLLLLCAISIGGIIFLLLDDHATLTVTSSVLSLCAIVFAIHYCVLGYKKNAARFVVIFSIILSLIVLLKVTQYYVNAEDKGLMPSDNITIESSEVSEEIQTPESLQGETLDNSGPTVPIRNVVRNIITVLIFGMLFTLSIAKDLGKKKSYWLIGSSVILSLFNYIIGSIHIQSHSIAIKIFLVSGIEFTIFILCAIYGVMVYAKYKDKEARGTK